CNHCQEELEHRDHRLANHIASVAKCQPAPAVARTAAHVLMTSKKRGAEDASEEGSSTAPPRKKAKLGKQKDLDGFVDRPMTRMQENTANRKLLRYFIHSNTPFVQANSVFLEDFTQEIRPSFKIASRNVM
ncbi:hypothetical protein FB45DRAFT_698498, partial [Roridomyces roridus]